jgi:hypothetical protein
MIADFGRNHELSSQRIQPFACNTSVPYYLLLWLLIALNVFFCVLFGGHIFTYHERKMGSSPPLWPEFSSMSLDTETLGTLAQNGFISVESIIHRFHAMFLLKGLIDCYRRKLLYTCATSGRGRQRRISKSNL